MVCLYNVGKQIFPLYKVYIRFLFLIINILANFSNDSYFWIYLFFFWEGYFIYICRQLLWVAIEFLKIGMKSVKIQLKSRHF